MIWKAALLPRIVSIRKKVLGHTASDGVEAGLPHNGVDRHLQSDSSHEPMLGLVSDSPLPHILFVCQESYGIASKHYHKAFSTVGSTPKIHFDFQRDTLYLRHYVMENENRTDGTIDHLWFKVLPFLKSIENKTSLKLVENLALLVDWRPDRDDLYHGIPASISRWVCHILQIFGGVKHLTLVVEEYISPSEVQSPICFMEPVDVGATLFEIGTYEGDIHGDYRGGPDWHWLSYHEVTKKYLEAYQATELYSRHQHWDIPALEHKIVVTEDLKEHFETAARACEEKFRKRTLATSEMNLETWLELEEQSEQSETICQTVAPDMACRPIALSVPRNRIPALHPQIQQTPPAFCLADGDFSDDENIQASI